MNLPNCLRRLVLIAIVFMAAASCRAQSCAFCYTQAASAGKRMVQGLRSGILVLIVPPTFMSAGITVMAYRKRNKFARNRYVDRDNW